MSKMIRLFISQSFNMCGVLLIANLNLSEVPFIEYIHEHFPAGKYFFTGPHPDFTRFWYVKVGMSILVLKAIGIIFPQILSIIFMVPACMFRRIMCAHKAIVQVDMNKYYEGLTMHLWSKYASTMANVFYSMMFCAGIPLLLSLQAIGLIVQYWIDKFLCNPQ